MHRSSANPSDSALKLYPRLSLPKRPQKAPHFTIRKRRNPTLPQDPREADRVQLRARLLRMILDNEQARRNGPRPTAG